MSLDRRLAPGPKSTLPFVPTRCPGIPSLFGGVAFGMTRAHAQKVSDGGEITASPTGWTRYPEIDPHGWARTFSYGWSKADQLDLLDVELTEPELAELKAAWGQPVSYGEEPFHYLAWFDPAARVRVQARPTSISKRDGDVRGYAVDIQPYVPLAELLGPSGLIAQPMFGKSVDQIAAMFPGALDVTTKAQKAAELKSVDPKLEGLASDDWIDLNLPGTELEAVRVRLEVDEHRLVKSYSFALKFWKDKALGDELLATTIAALGQPTVEHRRGSASYGFTAKGGVHVKAELDPQFGWLSFEVTPTATTH